MARKTIDVESIKLMVNTKLAEMDDTKLNNPAWGLPPLDGYSTRRGYIVLLENILHVTGTYKGFMYLNKTDIPAGNKPGINISPIDGQHLEDYEARFKDTDRTRVHYY